MTYNISRTNIEASIFGLYKLLYKLTDGNSEQAWRELSPLQWYINTGRATCEFLRTVFTAKQFMVARKLHMGGSDQEVIKRIMDYIGYDPN